MGRDMAFFFFIPLIRDLTIPSSERIDISKSVKKKKKMKTKYKTSKSHRLEVEALS